MRRIFIQVPNPEHELILLPSPRPGGTLSRPGETSNPKHSSVTSSSLIRITQKASRLLCSLKHHHCSQSLTTTLNMATPKIPETMRSLCTRKFGAPSEWEIAELPTPKITKDDDVIVKVHAAAINPTDIGGAAGAYWPAFSIP
jgi:hypothetical protein